MPTFYNQATLSYNNGTTSSNIVQGEYVEALSATKTALSSQYQSGDSITFAVSVINSGPNDYTDLTLTDNLGAYTFGTDTLTPMDYVDGSLRYYVNGVLQDITGITAGPPLTVTGLSLPADSSALILYTARINPYAPLGADGSIINTATIDGTGLTAAVLAQSTLPAASGLQLSISKAVCPATVTENQPVTYTLTIFNTGSTAAVGTDDVVVSDVFDPALDISAVRFNGTLWTEGTQYSYDAATGAFSTLLGYITVPAATYTQDPQTGAWAVTPGVSTLTITGTLT